jgi:hypothetical protein
MKTYTKLTAKNFAKNVSKICLEKSFGKKTNSRYIDPYVICPFYAYEESSTVRKIHCESYKKGIYVHLYFKDKCLKKEHKTNYCNNKNAYKECPLYQGNLEYFKEHNKDD